MFEIIAIVLTEYFNHKYANNPPKNKTIPKIYQTNQINPKTNPLVKKLSTKNVNY